MDRALWARSEHGNGGEGQSGVGISASQGAGHPSIKASVLDLKDVDVDLSPALTSGV